jgi:hypothetical protein
MCYYIVSHETNPKSPASDMSKLGKHVGVSEEERFGPFWGLLGAEGGAAEAHCVEYLTSVCQ